MNFLAHFQLAAHLSHHHRLDLEIQIAGAFLADFIRGEIPSSSAHPCASANIFWQAVQIHRHVDSFTDQHPVFRQCKTFFPAPLRHYTPVLIDVFFDAVLATRFDQYRIDHCPPNATHQTTSALMSFSHICYTHLANHYRAHPDVWNDEAIEAFRHMQSHNWLARYATMRGIEKTLAGISTRFRRPIDLVQSIPDYLAHEHDFVKAFTQMWPELQHDILLW